MDDLVAFLRSRLDEDEQIARAASEEDWTNEYEEFQSRGGPDFDHILRHSPSRVLREVEAKRRIIDRGSDWTSNEYEAWPVLAMLALAYSDHPDYRPQEWKP